MVSALPTIEIISGGNTSILHFEFCILHFAHLRDKLQFELQVPDDMYQLLPVPALVFVGVGRIGGALIRRGQVGVHI